MHKTFKDFMKRGPADCDQMVNLGLRIPKGCLKSNTGQSGGPPPPPGNRSIDELKKDYPNNPKVEHTMRNLSKGIVGLVNGAMQIYRTLACVLCAGPTDFPNIFDTNGNVKINQANFTTFTTEMKENLYRVRESEKNCSDLVTDLLNNLTDTTKPSCSNVKTFVQNKRPPNKPGKCNDNATCESITGSVTLTNPQGMLTGANMDNGVVTDDSGATPTRLLRSMQTSTVTTGGITLTTKGDDD